MSGLVTSVSSMIGLETLRGVNRGLQSAQSEVSSGKRISSANTNAAIWAVSSVMSGDASSYSTISESLSLGASKVAVARNVSEKVVSTLEDIKSLVVQAQSGTADRQKYQDDIDQKVELIRSYVDSAQFNGQNLIDGTSPEAVEVLSSLDRSEGGSVNADYISVERRDLSDAGLGSLSSINVVSDPSGALSGIETALNTATDTAAYYGAAQNQISAKNEFVSSLVDTMKTGVSALVDADLAEASTKLQARQVQQQLSVQALSIVNQAPQALLSLLA